MPIDPSEVTTAISGWLAGGMTGDQIAASVATVSRLAALAEIRNHVPPRPSGFDSSTVVGILQALVQLESLELPLSPGEATGYYVEAIKSGTGEEALADQWATACMAIGAMVIASGRSAELIALLPPEEEA